MERKNTDIMEIATLREAVNSEEIIGMLK
jgi:hypothetical protein